MKNNHSNARTVLIIGAGAAGLMAGIRAAEKDPNWQVLIAERMERPGRKLRLPARAAATSPTAAPSRSSCPTC